MRHYVVFYHYRLSRITGSYLVLSRNKREAQAIVRRQLGGCCDESPVPDEVLTIKQYAEEFGDTVADILTEYGSGMVEGGCALLEAGT